MDTPFLQMLGITKSFSAGSGGWVAANRDINLTAQAGTIHAVIGENGAGKSTLMNVLYGRHTPDRGRILLEGREVHIGSPLDAIRLGIGMVSQHTTLIPALTVLENLVLGASPASKHRPVEKGLLGVIDQREAEERVAEVGRRLGTDMDLHASTGSLSVAALQKAEIVKALYRGVRLLILDEPTATLAPQEAEALFALLHKLASEGATILLVTHRLREVMEHAHAVTVLREGRSVAELPTEQADPADLVRLMIGPRQAAPEVGPLTGEDQLSPHKASGAPLLELQRICVRGRGRSLAVADFSLTVAEGEIVGVAGIDGSGQRELAETIVGLRPIQSGTLSLGEQDISSLSRAQRTSLGIAYVPEDRQRDGLVLGFSVAENLLLGRQRDGAFGGGPFLNLNRIRGSAHTVIEEDRIKASGPDAPASTLSGGNQQKVVVARALLGRPRLLVAMQPARGLDVEAARIVYDQIGEATARGMGVLLFSLDLDEIFAVSDRIAVMYNGQLAGVLRREEATPELIGRMMLEGAA